MPLSAAPDHAERVFPSRVRRPMRLLGLPFAAQSLLLMAAVLALAVLIAIAVFDWLARS